MTNEKEIQAQKPQIPQNPQNPDETAKVPSAEQAARRVAYPVSADMATPADEPEMSEQLRQSVTLPAVPTNPFVDSAGRVIEEKAPEVVAHEKALRDQSLSEVLPGETPHASLTRAAQGLSHAAAGRMYREGLSPEEAAKSVPRAEAGQSERGAREAGGAAAALPAPGETADATFGDETEPRAADPDFRVTDRREQQMGITLAPGETARVTSERPKEDAGQDQTAADRAAPDAANQTVPLEEREATSRRSTVAASEETAQKMADATPTGAKPEVTLKSPPEQSKERDAVPKP